MTDYFSKQQALFQQIKDKLPVQLSLVDEVAETLSISTDSAYRRIRGEKELAFNEIEKLAVAFGISLDFIFHQEAEDLVSFRYNSLNEETFNYGDYLKSICTSMRIIATSQQKQMMYSAKDVPVFYHFLMDEIAWFKMFVWQKTIIGFQSFEGRKFKMDDAPAELLKLGKQSLNDYLSIPCLELWNEESFSSLFRQIEFYADSGLFANPSDAMMLIEKTEVLVAHLKKQAEAGTRFLIGEETPQKQDYKMYYNEVVLTDNTVVAVMGDKITTFLTHNALNFLATSNERFGITTKAWVDNMVKRSSQISSTSEKARNRFFSRVELNLSKVKENVRFMTNR